MQLRTLGFIGAALLTLAIAPAAFAQQYTVTDLGTLGGTFAVAAAINNSGTIVGNADLAGNATAHAFVYTNGVMKDLGTFGGSYSEALAINDSGTIVGDANTTGVDNEGNPIFHAFSYTNGVMTDLGTLGGDDSTAFGINSSGTIVGTSYVVGTSDYHGFTYTNGVLKDLGTSGGAMYEALGINDSGTIVGENDAGDDIHAFSYANGTFKRLPITPDGTYFSASAINNSETIVGLAYLPGNVIYHACSYANGITKDLGTFGGDNSAASGINSSGTIVGYAYLPGSKVSHAFIYANGAMTDLNALLPVNSGWALNYANGINDNGWIVGEGTINGQTHAFLLKPVASPTSKISGTLTLDGIAANATPQNVTFTLRPSDASGDLTQTASVPASGAFSLSNLPRKNYTVHIKGDKYLAVNVSVDATGGDVAGVKATLAAGDANNDNSVDTSDFGILVGAYGSDASIPGSGYDATADFNSDGLVDTTDFALLVGSYGQSGDL